MTHYVGTVERAYQLARTGEYKTVREIKARLSQEDYFDATSQIMGRSLVRELGRCCRAAQVQSANIQHQPARNVSR
jgi:hypothetical protein